jgi:hypothetical protein
MKTSELIKQLQEADPTGFIEVCCDGGEIIFVENQEAYYDGKLQTVKRDEKGQICGMKITTRGRKIRLHVYDLEDAILDQPEIPVELDIEDYQKLEMEKKIESLRQETRDIIEKINKDNIERNKTKMFKTSFGMYVPLDYETYKKMKAINSVINVSRLKVNKWKRWSEKASRNRFYKKPIIEDGRKIGTEKGDPIPEPEVCDVFFQKKPLMHWLRETRQQTDNNGELMFVWFARDYKNWVGTSLYSKWQSEFEIAKKPCKEDEWVKEIMFSKKEIEEMYEKIKDYYFKWCKKG